ncbi:MAG: amino acid adenylation domain-containing protein, partial [Desulfovibrionaceae bacterium]
LVEDWDGPREPGRNPLFDVLVTMEPAGLGDPPPAQAGPGDAPDAAPQASPAAGSKFDLAFHFEPGPRGLTLDLRYADELFTPGRAERLAAQVVRRLEQAARHPEAPVGELDLLPPEERRLVLETCNATARPYPRDANLVRVFSEVAAARGSAPALAWEAADGSNELRTMSYRELDRRSGRLARALLAAGAGPGQVVGAADLPGPDLPVAVLAILKTGAAYMPLDPKDPPARLAAMAKRAGCRLGVAGGPEADGTKALARGLPGVTLLAPDAEGPADGPDAPLPGPDVPAEACAYVLFTSGSTGEPKAVGVPHRAVLRLVCNNDFYPFGPEDGCILAAPPAFDASTLEFWGPLLTGGRLGLPDRTGLLEPGGLARAIRRFGVTFLWLTATLCHRLADDEPESFRPLRALFTGGEAVSPVRMRRILDACPGLRLHNGYGPTENTVFTTTWRIRPADTRGPVPLGRPVANTRAYVLDAALRPTPIGVWGEICAAGDGLALGYLGREDLTAAAFVHSPELPGERLYRTGDLGRWREDGVLEFGGRRDGQVKVRGHRVETGEVEAALAALPGVREAVVLAVSPGEIAGGAGTDDGNGGGGNGDGEGLELAAVVRADAGGPEQWRAALQARLPAWLVPARFLVVAELPVTASGKADRRALVRRLAEAPRPAPQAPTAGAADRDTAAVVTRAFEAVLERSGVGPRDNFFHLGGHSLKAMRLLARLRRDLGRAPGLREFMAAPTVEATAAALAAPDAPAPTAAPQPIPALAEAPDYALSGGQRRLWTLQRMAPASAAYNVAGAVRLTGPMDPARLARALAAVVRRHEPLRSRVVQPDGPQAEPRLVVDPAPGPDAAAALLPLTDCAAGPDPEALARTAMETEANRPFDPAGEPLLRARLLRLGPDRHILFVCLHHLVADGWSVSVLLTDLARAWTTDPGDGSLPALPDPAPRHRDWAAWSLSRRETPAARARLDFWRAELADLPEPLDLPADRPRPALQDFTGAALEFALPGALAEGLRRLGAETGLFPALAAVTLALLHRLTGRQDMILGVPTAGRHRPELEPLVGLFVNTLPLRGRVDPDEPFAALLART